MALKWHLLCFYFLSIAGLFVYLKGYFPIKISTVGFSSSQDVPLPPSDSSSLLQLSEEEFGMADGRLNPILAAELPRNFTKLVLVVVNALRLDFLFSPEHLHSTRFVHKSLKFGDALGFVARAQSPAVTMLRIKALVTGSVPSYSDIILSLDQTKELREDSFVNSAFSSGRSVVFYGDDTWTKMFPGKFKREGAVKDFLLGDVKLIDDNITREAERELEHPDNFDIMILHLIGLGHIGHIAGSKSPLIVDKLREVDLIVQKIYEALAKHDTSKDSNSLVVLTGDHGMTDKGSHGGTTHHERDVPLVFLSPGITKVATSDEPPTEVMQTDLVPTLSALLGLPIPRNSMGQLTKPLIEKMTHAGQLQALQYNTHHLLSLAGKLRLLDESDFEPVHPVTLYRDALLSHATWLRHPDIADKKFKDTWEQYNMCQQAVSDKLMYHVVSYNHVSMGCGVGLTWLAYIMVVATWARIVLTSHNTEQSGAGTPNSPMTWGVLVTMGTMFHGVSLLSSSFLEEEHQTWYFMTATFLMVLFVNVTIDRISTMLGMTKTIPKGFFSKKPQPAISPPSAQGKLNKTELLQRSRPEESWDFVELGGLSDDEYTFDRTRKSSMAAMIPDSNGMTMAVLATTLVAHRLLREWNSTGIQSVDEPDIGDWLNDRDHYQYLVLSHLVGLACVASLLEALTYGCDAWRRGLTWLGFVMVFLYRMAAAQTLVKGDKSIDALPAGFAYLIIALIAGRAIFVKSQFAAKSTSRRTMDYVLSCVVLLSVLLLRAHNVWGLAFNMILYWSVFRKLWPILSEDTKSADLQLGKVVLRTTLCYWFGQMAYFSLGNSNSLATIDVSAGYVGIATHSGTLEDTVVRLLLIYALYIGPIMWTTLCLSDVVEVTSKESRLPTDLSRRSLMAVFSTFAFLRLTPMSFYLILATALRYHLFVWSVFAPKLLLEAASTTIYGVMLLSAFIAAKLLPH